jgi:hypothetical protein
MHSVCVYGYVLYREVRQNHVSTRSLYI